MPLIVNNQIVTVNSVVQPVAATRTRRHPNEMVVPQEIAAKRAARDARRTKYTVVRKDKTPADYKRIVLMVDGVEFPLSDSAKYMLEQMVGDVSEAPAANTSQ